MTEEAEGAEGGGLSAGIDPAAMALAMGSASRTEADAFLRNQNSLTDLQKHHLREQFKQLRLFIWQQRVGVLLRVATAIMGLAAAGTLALLVWEAANSNGLLIEPFSVPPELAARGLTGEVVAAQFLDKLQAMQTATQSDRPANTYQNNWGDEIKLEIPETGLTFGEFKKLLRDELGHSDHVTGEIYETAAGIAMTARLGDAEPQTFQGSQADLEALEQKAAEAIYRDNQPYRFSQYLEQHGRIDEAFTVIADLAANGPIAERSWAYGQWAEMDLNRHGDVVAAMRHARLGRGSDPGAEVLADIQLVNASVWSGDREATLTWSKELLSKSLTRQPGQSQDFFDQNKFVAAGWVDSLYGDYTRAAENYIRVTRTPEYLGLTRLSYGLAATSYAAQHDLRAAFGVLEPLEPTDDISFLQSDANNAFDGLPFYWIAAERADWSSALADARAADAWLAAHKDGQVILGLVRTVWVVPLEAMALSRSGDVAGARSLIEPTSVNCYLCLRARGWIAAQSHDSNAADAWFAKAVHDGPSIPMAYEDWGRVLLQRGDAEGAIAKFNLSNVKGPHFADPLEGWGEALMAKNRSDLALEKFEEANKYAPNWGRLHLKWGEALYYAGKKDDAAKEFTKAGSLSLTGVEKIELEGVNRG